MRLRPALLRQIRRRRERGAKRARLWREGAAAKRVALGMLCLVLLDSWVRLVRQPVVRSVVVTFHFKLNIN